MLKDKKVAILVAEGFEQVELTGPRKALDEAGAQTRIVVEGRRITSWPSLRTDLTNAGAQWVDEEVVVDKGLVSSRKPQDIPAFNREMIALFDRPAAQ